MEGTRVRGLETRLARRWLGVSENLRLEVSGGVGKRMVKRRLAGILGIGRVGSE